MSATDSLQAVLRAEHAAIFGYGALGGHLTATGRALAAEAERGHRDRRDQVAELLIAAKADPVPPERAYGLPAPVSSAAGALKLAVLLEERTAAAWRAAVPQLTGAQRSAAIAGLTACAVQAARWRALAAPGAPATVAFPGV